MFALVLAIGIVVDNAIVIAITLYPSVEVSAAPGMQAFNPAYQMKLPESILYSVAADLVAPLINKNASIGIRIQGRVSK